MKLSINKSITYKLFYYTYIKAKIKPNDWPIVRLQTKNDKHSIIVCCYLNENDEVEINEINDGINKKEKININNAVNQNTDFTNEALIEEPKINDEDLNNFNYNKETKSKEIINENEIDLCNDITNEKQSKDILDGKFVKENQTKDEIKLSNLNEYKENKYNLNTKCDDLKISCTDENEDILNTKKEENLDSNETFNINENINQNTEQIEDEKIKNKTDYNYDITKNIKHTEQLKNDENNITENFKLVQNKLDHLSTNFTQKKAILFLHDRNQTRYDNFDFITSLQNLNYTILIPDLSGFADSKGKFTLQRSINDIQRCLDFLSSFDLTIVCVGFGALILMNYTSSFYDYRTVLINPITSINYLDPIQNYHLNPNKTVLFCVGQDECMDLGDKIGCRIYRSEADTIKSLMRNEEVVRKIDEFIQDEGNY